MSSYTSRVIPSFSQPNWFLAIYGSPSADDKWNASSRKEYGVDDVNAVQWVYVSFRRWSFFWCIVRNTTILLVYTNASSSHQISAVQKNKSEITGNDHFDCLGQLALSKSHSGNMTIECCGHDSFHDLRESSIPTSFPDILKLGLDKISVRIKVVGMGSVDLVMELALLWKIHFHHNLRRICKGFFAKENFSLKNCERPIP